MNISQSAAHDNIQSLAAMAEDLEDYVRQAAQEGLPLYDVEKHTLAKVLKLGRQALELFLRLQGDGDLGPSMQTAEGKTLYRSKETTNRELRTVFGTHCFHSYVYSSGPKKKIELRPVDARMSLGEGKCSYLLEEFSQHFWVDQRAHSMEAGSRRHPKVAGVGVGTVPAR